MVLNRKLTLISCILWLAGLTAAIAGMNLEGDAGKWLSVCGNIVFLAGLGLQGVLWLRKHRASGRAPAGSAGPEDSNDTDPKDAA